MLQGKILSLSNLSLLKRKSSFHETFFEKEKNKLLLRIYAWRFSGHLWLNGRQTTLKVEVLIEENSVCNNISTNILKVKVIQVSMVTVL